MKILQRYIFKELFLPFVICLVTLNFIFMAGYLVRAIHFIIGRGVPIFDTLYVLVLAMPEMISYTVPTSILTTILIVFGNLSQNNEIRAVKASGVHPLMLMLPPLLIGFVLSLSMFLFNDQITTNAGFILRKTTKQMMIKHPRALIEPGRFVKINDNIIFLTKHLDGNNMRDIVVYEIEDSENPVRTILAERGELIYASGQSQMKVRLYNGSVSDAKDKGVQAIQFETYEFSILGQSDVKNMSKKTRELTLAEILIRLSSHAALSSQDRRELRAAFHNRIAFSFGAFIFAFIGIPVAMLVRRGEIILSFAISMLMACLYYVFFVGAKTIALQGGLPPALAFWLPNFLLLGLGAYLFKRSLAS
ncbi:MAG: LptF/LptG family permease [Candidatus Omnitrophica bacterium]|nr:LptF/LptG family permease [Candidatus Omnitrophota bacterium]